MISSAAFPLLPMPPKNSSRAALSDPAGYTYEQRSAGYRIGPNLQFVNPNPLEIIDIPAYIAKRVNQKPSAAKLNRLYRSGSSTMKRPDDPQ